MVQRHMRQLIIPGLETNPWQLVEPVDPQRSQLMPPRRFATGGDGTERLLRALVHRGLEEDAWAAAAALVLELDAEVGEPVHSGSARAHSE
jgi:hypothetical protein